MKGQTNRSIIDNGLQRDLRSHLTEAEKSLWQRLRARQLAGFKFRRQHPFMDFVLDFVCLESRLVVEVDGGQHQDNAADGVRDRRLQDAGFRVLRFWSNQVLEETDPVVEAIWEAVRDPSPPRPSPCPKGYRPCGT